MIKTPIKVPLTLEFKDVTTIRYALGKILCSSERQAKSETDLVAKYESTKNAEYIRALEQKLYDAQWNSFLEHKKTKPKQTS